MDTRAVHVWLILWKAYEAVHGFAMEQIGSLDMCMSDFGILEILMHKGPQPINEIGRRLALTSGSMTAAIDRLEKRGLVSRQLKREDRRARFVTLTPAGKKLIARAFEEHAQALESAAQGLTKKEREMLITLLKKLGMQAAAARAELFQLQS